MPFEKTFIKNMHKKYGIFIKKEKIFTENGLYAQLRAYK
jgi:hypothetical protein